MTVSANASDREVQAKIMDLTNQFQLSLIHETPTRENNLLDIVLTTIPSLVKTSQNVPGISDHEIAVTYCDTKPYYQHSKPGKYYIHVYSKANWEKLKEDMDKTSMKIKQMDENGATTQELNDTFKTFRKYGQKYTI